ncbi:MAG: lysophospholipid acyltransferase family protein [Candidatus Omnitrophica bacterium]|nr:lysophospholipid acyltransferase family protein [Candidatus Omnitrophota bacterium]
MDSKKFRKHVSYFIGWLFLVACSLIAKLIPGKHIYSFARIVGGLGYRFASRQRKIAIEGLTVAFGKEKSARQIEKIARDCFIGMAKSGIELVYLPAKPELVTSRVRLEGREHLEKALSKGKGVILVSAHFGNFPLMLLRLSREGYKTGAIMRPMKDNRVERFFMRMRDAYKIKTIYSIPRKTCVLNSLKSLRANELLFIPLDQNFGTGGVFVDFFGRKAATAIGPIVLAQRTEAAVVPCFIVREQDDSHRIIFEPPLELAQKADDRETITLYIQKITDIIEFYIRQYPAAWGWIHRRWKSRPQSEKEGG